MPRASVGAHRAGHAACSPFTPSPQSHRDTQGATLSPMRHRMGPIAGCPGTGWHFGAGHPFLPRCSRALGCPSEAGHHLPATPRARVRTSTRMCALHTRVHAGAPAALRDTGVLGVRHPRQLPIRHRGAQQNPPTHRGPPMPACPPVRPPPSAACESLPVGSLPQHTPADTHTHTHAAARRDPGSSRCLD